MRQNETKCQSYDRDFILLPSNRKALFSFCAICHNLLTSEAIKGFINPLFWTRTRGCGVAWYHSSLPSLEPGFKSRHPHHFYNSSNLPKISSIPSASSSSFDFFSFFLGLFSGSSNSPNLLIISSTPDSPGSGTSC